MNARFIDGKDPLVSIRPIDWSRLEADVVGRIRLMAALDAALPKHESKTRIAVLVPMMDALADFMFALHRSDK